MWTCGGAIIVSVATRTAFVALGADRLYAYVLTPCRMDGLAIGCMVALILNGRGAGRCVAERARELLPKAKRLGALCAIAIAAIVAYHRTTGFVGGPGQAVGYTVVAAFFACVLIVTLASADTGMMAKLLTQRWLTVLGKYSYALYLFHMGIHRLVREHVYGPGDFHQLWGSRLPGQVIFYVICTGLSLAAAWASWNLLEKHFLKLKVLFPARRQPAMTVEQWVAAHVKTRETPREFLIRAAA
jgi:peptidoglycan/LPS O-acetylase OafA/YrhL